MDAPSEPAIGACDHILASDHLGVAHDAVGDHLRMLYDVGGVADHAGNEQLTLRQFHFLPHAPFVLVADIAGFHRVSAGVHAQHEIDDVGQRDVGGGWAVPDAPADVGAGAG